MALVEHMTYQSSRNALCWPKTAAEVRPRPTDVGAPDSEDEDDNISLGYDHEHEFVDDDEDEQRPNLVDDSDDELDDAEEVVAEVVDDFAGLHARVNLNGVMNFPS